MGYYKQKSKYLCEGERYKDFQSSLDYLYSEILDRIDLYGLK